ncbi:MAG: pseudouridine synthase [Patescibacteria group bacterium]
MPNEIKYPIRINRYLALKNICSRREADQFIAQGKIAINGHQAVLGEKVGEKDLVKVVKSLNKEYIYLAFNKPKRIITHSPQGEETSIEEFINYPKKVFPIGRLDKDSRGLIILTNDGRITDKLLNPEYNHEKEYIVKVHKPITETFVRKMGAGVVLDDGYKTKSCMVKKAGDYLFSIILTEGKKRQVRRMCQVLGYEAVDLKRVRILNIQLGDLHSGQLRKIVGRELRQFMSGLGLE